MKKNLFLTASASLILIVGIASAAFIASGTGIGADAAKHLSSQGYDVAIMSSSGKGRELAKALNGFGYTGSNLLSEDINEFINGVLDRIVKDFELTNSLNKY